MDGKSVKKPVLFLFLLAVLLWAAGRAFGASPYFDFNIQSHHLIVHIDPSERLLKAEDRLEINMKRGRVYTLSFLLHPHLKITRVVDQRTGQPLDWSEVNFSAHARRWDISLHKVEESPLLSISYEGPIYDPVAKEKELQFVRGDVTSGLISPEGVFLSNATHWYPDRPGSMSTFQIEATIP